MSTRDSGAEDWTADHTNETDLILTVAEAVWQDEPTEAELDIARQVVHAHKERVIDGMTVPPGGPEDAFWQGAQWAYGQVRDALFSSGVASDE